MKTPLRFSNAEWSKSLLRTDVGQTWHFSDTPMFNAEYADYDDPKVNETGISIVVYRWAFTPVKEDDKGREVFRYQCSCGWIMATSQIADVKRHLESEHGIYEPKFKADADAYKYDKGAFDGEWETPFEGHTISKHRYLSRGSYSARFHCTCGWESRCVHGSNDPAIEHVHRIAVKGKDGRGFRG